jgi:membrane protease YdiL (CAAX protease family)
MNEIGTLISEFLSAILNIFLFLIIPIIWHLAKERSLRGFIHSLGIYKLQSIKLLPIAFTVIPVYLITLLANITVILLGYSARSSVDTQNYTIFTLFLLLLFYGMKTGIAEEIFFRGFVARRLIGALGFPKGNLIQAVIFALPHFVIAGTASAVDIIVRIINAFLLGYMFGYVMHKKCDGSIIPVMAAHVLFNMISSVVLLSIL